MSKGLREQRDYHCQELLAGKWKYAIQLNTEDHGPVVHTNDDHIGAEISLYVCKGGPRLFDIETWYLADSEEELQATAKELWKEYLRDCGGAPPDNAELRQWLGAFPFIEFPELEAAKLKNDIKDLAWRHGEQLRKAATHAASADEYLARICKLKEQLAALEAKSG